MPNNIMGETEFGCFLNAFFLSNHIFEVVQTDMSKKGYERVRQDLSEIASATLAARSCDQVTNLEIQLSVLRDKSLSDMVKTLTSQLQLQELCAAADRDIQAWKKIPPNVRQCLYSSLKEVSGNSNWTGREKLEMVADLVYNLLDLLGKNILVLFPQEQKPEEQFPEHRHAHYVQVRGAHGMDFTEDERRELLDAVYDILSALGISDAVFSILPSSLWIVISTLTPLSVEQQSDLVSCLDKYVQDCRSGKHGPQSAGAWMFAKSVQLTNSALVPISVLNRLQLVRYLQSTGDALSTWLDANGIKAIVAEAYKSDSVSKQQVRLFQHGQELEGSQLLRNTSGLQITLQKRWEELTWPSDLGTAMSEISKKKDLKELPWAESKSFQDFAVAVRGLCSSDVSQLCIQRLQHVLQSDTVMDNSKDGAALLTAAPGSGIFSHFVCLFVRSFLFLLF